MDNFLLPTLLIHQFERAEREGDYYLKQLTVERMLRYFFPAGHVKHARYLTQYLLEMRHLPADVKRDLVSGALVCVDTTRGTGMLPLETNLESRHPSGWAKEL